jgi:hypothetical protein
LYSLASPAALRDRGLELIPGGSDVDSGGAPKRSRYCVGRVVRPDASAAPPPARRNPSDAGREKNRRVTSTWKR